MFKVGQKVRYAKSYNKIFLLQLNEVYTVSEVSPNGYMIRLMETGNIYMSFRFVSSEPDYVAGDKVVCIDHIGCSRLRRDTVYTVKRQTKNGDFLLLEELGGGYLTKRFKRTDMKKSPAPDLRKFL
jgi:hypothetical protein